MRTTSNANRLTTQRHVATHRLAGAGSWVTRVALCALLIAPAGLGCKGLGMTKGAREKRADEKVTQLSEAVSQEERIRGRQFETDEALLEVIDATLKEIEADPATDLSEALAFIDTRVSSYPETMDFKQMATERDILMSRYDAVLMFAPTAEERDPVATLKRATNQAFTAALDVEVKRGGDDKARDEAEQRRLAAEAQAKREAEAAFGRTE